MKFVLPTFLLVNSVAAFARPFTFWGRSVSSFKTATATAPSTIVSKDHAGTCLHASSTTTVTSRPTMIDADNWDLLSNRGQVAVANLIQADEGYGAQTHVYGNWPPAGTDDEGKKRLAEQVGCFVSTLL